MSLTIVGTGMSNWLNDSLLGLANLLTSSFTAITGVGGGMMLIAIMPMLMPAVAVVPVHAVTQLVGNASRAWFGRKDIVWQPIRTFLIGSIVGMLIFGTLIRFITLDLIPLFIAIYILLLQWSKPFNRMIKRFERYFIVGLLQTGLGVFVGTPGPLNIAVLNNHYDDSNLVVTTGALMMTIVHTAKIVVYLSMGFAFLPYWRLIVFMMVMAIIGSWLGTKLRYKISPIVLKKMLPYLLTILAAKLIIDTGLTYLR